MQTPYSQLGEALSKGEWHDTHRTWSSYEAWGSQRRRAEGELEKGLRRSWIVATGCWVVGFPLYVYRPGQPPGRLLEDYGDDVVLFWMVAGPILLLLVGRLVVWANRGFPQRIDPPAN